MASAPRGSRGAASRRDGRVAGRSVSVALDRSKPSSAGIRCRLPAASRRAAARSRSRGRSAPGEQLLVLLSGGASALMAVPADGLTLDDKRRTTDRLLRAGADIHALNTVRKHLSAIKGGWLAASASGALAHAGHLRRRRRRSERHRIGADRGRSIDVRGGARRPAVVTAASARIRRPVIDVPDGGRPRGAAGDAQAGRPPARATAETVGDRQPARRDARRGGGSRDARVSRGRARGAGRRRGARRRRARTSRRSPDLATRAGRPLCVISSGETTVRVTGAGRGGRNQEFALAAAEPAAVRSASRRPRASAPTASTVPPTRPARSSTARRSSAPSARGSPRRPAYLDDNNSYAFFAALGDLINTGPTGTNVGDLQVFLLA